MAWRGRVSIHDDLSRLHEGARAADTSREIGYSSITQGEGSLDLLTESGARRGVFGDQPDGRFGIALWHRQGLRFLTDLLTEYEAVDADHDSRISDLGRRMIAVGNRMLDAEGRLDRHNDRIHDNDGRISGLGNRMVAAESTLGSHNSRISGLGERMLDVEGQGRAHNTRINAAQSRADSAYTRAGTGISNAATAQSRADSAYSRADSAYSRAGTAQSRADSAYSLASGRATQADIRRLETSIADLRGRLKNLEDWRNSLY